jgi:hypothetical protein
MFEDEIFAGNLSEDGDGYDIFVLNHSADGEIRYIKTAGAASSDFGMAACLAPDNSLYISGYYFFYANFDGTTIGNAENGDAFIARLTNVLDGGNLVEHMLDSCISWSTARKEIWWTCTGIQSIKISDLRGRVIINTSVSNLNKMVSMPSGFWIVEVTFINGKVESTRLWF